MPIRFSAIILIFIALFGSAIYVFHLFGLVTAANEVYVRFIALGIFIAGFGFLGWQKARHHRFSWDDIYKNNTLIIATLTVLLTSLFLYQEISHYAIGIFVGASFVHFLYTRKFYPPNKLFYFVFLYALLLFFRTIGTEHGFHFPDRTLAFYVLPLAFCFFQLSKDTLLKIAEVFFKTTILFLAICVLYWWYNFLHLDANFIQWITEKTNHLAQMTGWETQATTHHSLENVVTRDTLIYYSGYFFVNSWSGFTHPTFVSIILFFGLIVGFYLYYKKNTFLSITKLDLALYIVLCFFVILLMQSRVGIVGFLIIICISSLYYLKYRTKFFKLGLLLLFVFGSTALYVTDLSESRFTTDETRDVLRQVSVSYIKENFWWGAGFRQERIVLQRQAEKMENVLADVPPHILDTISYSHNQFLGDTVQFGIWGFIVLMAMLVAIALYAIRSRSYLLQMFLCSMFLIMLIDQPLYIQTGITRFMVFLVFFTAISEPESRKFYLIKNEPTET